MAAQVGIGAGERPNDLNFKAYKSSIEVEELISAFESCTLPRSEWTHRAHLTVGMWYLLQHSKEKATVLIRESIRKYNQACGILTTKESGYHETITLFYVHVISKYLEQTNADHSMVDQVNKLVEKYGDRNYPLEYYSRERLMSQEARQRWVEPDLRPLD